jgi:hypothetical protein
MGGLAAHEMTEFRAAPRCAQRNIVFDHHNAYGLRMKLCQGQLWKQGDEYIRIVRLERLEVEYKSLEYPTSTAGTRHVTSKKDFCRLLKQARLLNPDKAALTTTTSPPQTP